MEALGRTLAAIQVAQVGSGLIGQIILLARWSPHAQTDLFLVLSSVPWLVSAALVVGGMEMIIPAFYLQTRASGGEAEARQLVAQISGLSFAAGLGAALIGGMITTAAAYQAGLSLSLCVWMGVAMGGQALPAAWGGLWRGLLVAEDRLIQVRSVLLAGSLITVAGYGLLPGPPAFALPLSALAAVIGMAGMARICLPDMPLFPIRLKLPPTTRPLLRALLALSAAAGLAHLGTIIERGAVLPLGTGKVAALAVAGRGWEAVQAVIVAGWVLPAYPRWADPTQRNQRHRLLIESLRHVVRWSLIAAGVVGIGAFVIGPRLEWEAGENGARMALVLLPRFVLMCSIQPLVLICFASGTPWPPVIGSGLGLLVLGIGAWIVVPRWELAGFACTAALSVIPGWIVLGWYERRDLCAF